MGYLYPDGLSSSIWVSGPRLRRPRMVVSRWRASLSTTGDRRWLSTESGDLRRFLFHLWIFMNLWIWMNFISTLYVFVFQIRWWYHRVCFILHDWMLPNNCNCCVHVQVAPVFDAKGIETISMGSQNEVSKSTGILGPILVSSEQFGSAQTLYMLSTRNCGFCPLLSYFWALSMLVVHSKRHAFQPLAVIPSRRCQEHNGNQAVTEALMFHDQVAALEDGVPWCSMFLFLPGLSNICLTACIALIPGMLHSWFWATDWFSTMFAWSTFKII